jgi:Tol biopolymer transport system component
MLMTSTHRRWATVVLLPATLAACGSATEPTPTTGTIELNVATTGTDPDPDGYHVAIDGLDQAVPANGTVTWTGGAGTHTLAITGLAFNCDVMTSAATAPVTLGATTHVDVAVSCGPYLRNAIIYTSEEFGFGEVMVMRPDGSRRQRLTTDQAVYAAPTVSPDGQTIAVASRLGGSWGGIYLLNRFGGGRTKLVGHSTFDGSPAWSPDGTKLAFRSEVPTLDGNVGRIFVINRDGTGLRQLSPEPTDYGYDDGPAWSPDGTRVLYSHTGVLTVINADGTGLTSLGISGAGYPAWSPDGSRIAFEGVANQQQVVFTANADGSNMRQLATPVQADLQPGWSPDGAQIVFQRVEANVSHIYKLAADGTGPTRLGVVAQNESGPEWTRAF